MKIEVDSTEVDHIVKEWLVETVDISKKAIDSEELDIEFWEGLKERCEWILSENFNVLVKESID